MPTQLENYKQLKQDYLDIFLSEKGRRVFKDMANKGFLHRTTFRKDAIEMAFNEGQRSALLHIQNMQNLDLEKIAKQLKEQEES